MSAVETAPAAAVRLRITEIFASLQGESTRVGLPTVFVRLTGCPLRCSWCDTAYAFSGGETRTLDDILAEVAGHGLRHVCVTGGEPLAQKGCLALLAALCDAGHDVSLETSGALDIAGVDPRVSRIVDIKAPGYGELARNRWENLALLNARDELKFVLADATDYDPEIPLVPRLTFIEDNGATGDRVRTTTLTEPATTCPEPSSADPGGGVIIRGDFVIHDHPDT